MLNEIEEIDIKINIYANILPNDEGVGVQIRNIIDITDMFDIESISPIRTSILDMGIIEREYEIKFVGAEFDGVNIVESIREIYPLTKFKYITWTDSGQVGRIVVQVYTN